MESSFCGETGAYQATAIALASDILGSAVTTITYAKHKNIDLKRGWIMLTCILTMSTVGSYVAWLVGNVVLGSFTLFLTFFIGIRFLIKPDTSRENTVDKGEKLDRKGVAISLFFRSDHWIRHRFCRDRRRYDDACRFYRILKYGSENRCRNKHFYYDFYGAYCISQPYHHPPGHHSGALGCPADLYCCCDNSISCFRTICQQG